MKDFESIERQRVAAEKRNARVQEILGDVEGLNCMGADTQRGGYRYSFFQDGEEREVFISDEDLAPASIEDTAEEVPPKKTKPKAKK